ncbi:MAG: hypothetical protein AAF715_07705 [Myxococcota bacterium]
MPTPSSAASHFSRSSRRLGVGLAAAAVAAMLALGCAETPAPFDAATAPTPAGPPTPLATKTEPVPSVEPASATLAPTPTAAPSSAATADAEKAAAFRSLIERLSEPNGKFFSDNFISNETSYLQIADRLPGVVPTGGAYVGVGPEQNFTYIALTQPKLAFIVDVRRDNMVLHLMYKALFDLAQDRAHFLALLTGRDYAPKGVDVPSLKEALDIVAAAEATEDSFRAAHLAVRTRLIDGYGFTLDDSDGRSLRRAHRAFFDDGLDIRFTLKEASWRKYPSLRELVVATAPSGRKLGFLATDEHFRRIQRMHRQHRIVPVVGNFGGDRTFTAIGRHLETNDLTLRTLYVSNVEQYLMVDGLWSKWQRNVAALPADDRSVFIRGYLDQGRRHPQQMAGHRTATTLHRVADFNARKRPYGSMYLLATDGVI